MAVVLRMKRIGTIKKPFFRLVAVNKTESRDGNFIEELGHYEPKKKKDNFKINAERIQYWLKVGAIPSETVKSFIKKAGIEVAK
ncbi:Ribosomal protein S16 [Candidatus Omnitrophus magneticus]|uniref:Small ribosomal subunit protein bS16 n=1 Tax=Candidatus Omnitrophus magneticus TaxID=1609969 RepID=A0A0F0CNZ2_9BACT|nr:Ribosomal protein S16 [Candidatus Omnitrophus magneticus]